MNFRNALIAKANAVITNILQLSFGQSLKDVPGVLAKMDKIRSPLPSDRLRVAVVKLPVQLNLYTINGGRDAKSLLESSIGHTGPIALFTKFDSQFFIIDTVNDPDCQYWTQKAGRRGQRSLDDYLEGAREPREQINGASQYDVAIKPDSIDWGRFDVVIALDACVPPKITKEHPDILWCYMPTEPNMPYWHTSHTRVVEGYDLFLTQRPWSGRKRPSHVCDFPWALQYPGIYEELFGARPRSRQVFFEGALWRRTGMAPDRPATYAAVGPTGSMGEVAKALMESRYFAFYGQGDRRLWGNAVIEAICAGAVPLGGPGNQKNRNYLLKEIACVDSGEMAALIAEIDEDGAQYGKISSALSDLVERTCFSGPLGELYRALLSKRTATQAR